MRRVLPATLVLVTLTLALPPVARPAPLADSLYIGLNLGGKALLPMGLARGGE